MLADIAFNIKGVKCGPVKAYSEMSIEVSIFNDEASTKLKVSQKDQDIAIYTEMSFKSEKPNENFTLQIPLISIECKTYIDKTMLESSISTARRIKTGNPQSKFYIVSETWDISDNEKPNPHEIDNIFVIRKCRRRGNNSIDPKSVISIYDVILGDIQNLKSNLVTMTNIESIGRLKE